MIKIKDNIDLKELEKYGFKPKYDENTGEIDYMYYEISVDIFVYKIMIISYKEEIKETYHRPFTFFKWVKPKQIRFPKSYHIVEVNDYGAFLSEKTTDILYDLIKDGIVEKVE